MLKYILLALIFCIQTQSFCATNATVNASLSVVYAQSDLKIKQQNGTVKQAFLKAKNKRFPIFGIGGIVSLFLAILLTVTGNIDERLLLMLVLASLVLSIMGLAIGEFWVWSVLGLLLSLLTAITFFYLLLRAGKQC